MKETKIQWCDHTFNPWWGCARVSPGCEHCYAETFAKRVGAKVWGAQAERRFFGDKHWAEPLRWNAAAERDGVRRRVFCASMADVFEDRADLLEPRARLHTLVRETSHLDWLILTKRPENADRLWSQAHCDAFNGADSLGLTWAPNVWLGTTAEDQRRADERIPKLLEVRARVRFLSCEPLLEHVDLSAYFGGAYVALPGDRVEPNYNFGIDWVIVGAESGTGARPFDLTWARSIVAQCRAASVPAFVKQLGRRPVVQPFTGRVNQDAWSVARFGEYDPDPDVYELRDRKGGDPSEWPEDLRVREWPEPRR